MCLWLEIDWVSACLWSIRGRPRRRLALCFCRPEKVSKRVGCLQRFADKKRLPRCVGGRTICGILRNLG